MKPNLQRMTRAAWATLLAGVLMTVSSQPARAQSQQDEPKQPPDVQQLKDRVKQLEQTVEELKGQINAVESTQKEAAEKQSTATPVGEAIAAGAPAPVPGPAPKQEEKKIGGTFEVYGFAMLDMGYQFGQNHPDWFDVDQAHEAAGLRGRVRAQTARPTSASASHGSACARPRPPGSAT